MVQAAPLAFYALALLLSLAWCPLFARWHLLDWALADACMLLAAVLAVFFEFSKVRPDGSARRQCSALCHPGECVPDAGSPPCMLLA